VLGADGQPFGRALVRVFLSVFEQLDNVVKLVADLEQDSEEWGFSI
jgi:hypothetical protein